MLFFTLFSQILEPSFRLNFFAPFLIIVFYQSSFLSSLYLALLAGLIIDIFASPLRFGVYALNYTITSAFLYGQRKNYFSDSLMTLPIMTFLFAVVSTVLQVCLLLIFSKIPNISIAWFFSDLLLMPALDAFFAFCWFILGSMFFGKNSYFKTHRT